MRKSCLTCGKKFYPNSYYSYPDSEGEVGEGMIKVPAEHKHFHSLKCMKLWLAKNSEAFNLLLTNMGNNDNNNETIERT